jgi:hypothetical protein
MCHSVCASCCKRTLNIFCCIFGFCSSVYNWIWIYIRNGNTIVLYAFISVIQQCLKFICLCVGRCPPRPVSLFWPAPTPSPSFWLAQAVFEPNVLPNIPTILTLVILMPTRLWRCNRQCSEMLAFKPQTPVNHPHESIQHLEHSKSLKSRISVCL